MKSRCITAAAQAPAGTVSAGVLWTHSRLRLLGQGSTMLHAWQYCWITPSHALQQHRLHLRGS